MVKSILYKYPWMYKLGLRFLHGKSLEKRYKYISNEIGKNKKVLEPGCGPALLASYLNEGCIYYGFDINNEFINYAKKKGINVYYGDCLKTEPYRKSDVIVLCDVLHHLGRENEKKVLQLCNKNSKKIIICEQPVSTLFKKILFAVWIFNYLDKDGRGKVDIQKLRTERELLSDMQNGFSVFNRINKKIVKIGKDIIAIYY